MGADAEGPPHPYPRRIDLPTGVPVGAEELRRELAAGRAPLLVDVRPSAERELARLAGDRWIPLAELPRRLGELPRDRSIVLYCQFGAQAARAAEFLRKEGYLHVAPLAGGIDGYAREVDPTIPRYDGTVRDGLVVRSFPRPASGCLAYLVGDAAERRAVLIDPGREIEGYLAALAEGRWQLAAIVETHTHADHLAGHAALAERTGAPIFLGRRSPAAYPHRALADGEALAFGTRELTVWETPGHTRDHLTLRVDGRMFTGDTLLLGSCGRTDLADGDPDRLWESLTEKLLTVPDATEVLPAHYGARHALPERWVSTMGFERASNEALSQGSREGFRRYMSEGWPPKPDDFDRIVRENLAR
jgi:glyoxylase-like metal-dependent hydrolase (beta-lactamase superfamily II)